MTRIARLATLAVFLLRATTLETQVIGVNDTVTQIKALLRSADSGSQSR